ncbi:hypothetical protein PLICRDRAFT_178781 [Plicaturopsis crispa FD-325 SS-3]|uniref:EF-hand domain-containing protein n=1 Tax=Plicaturopsis crispa FD-325 SS-3 TaxID=944288 RepID=A0A0C9SL79_PLICR|nr:hypothetical protein PLICRDRAFT_178781 [Plicaturopsis crispa FD-325 SS-3]
MSLTERICKCPTQLRMRLDGPTQTSLHVAEERISKISEGEDKGSKKAAKEIVCAANQVFAVLEIVAKVYPPCEAAVAIFKVVVNLELGRRENNEQIAVICHSMTRMMYVIHHLAPVIDREGLEESMRKSFETELAAMEALIKKFGEFSSLYYKHKQITFRLIFSKNYKERLEGFSKAFRENKEKFEVLISSCTARSVEEIRGDVKTLSEDVHKVISMLGVMNKKQKGAMDYIMKHGGPERVAEDHVLLGKVAETFGETIDGPLRKAIQDDLESLLEKNRAHAERKIKEGAAMVLEAIRASKDAILTRLEAGPHELIEDPDIREIWKGVVAFGLSISPITYPTSRVIDLTVVLQRWGMNVKSRIFVDTIHDHFYKKFCTDKEDNDFWTLNILSKIVYHGNLSDAIDDDGSGFLSVREVNDFLKDRTRADLKWSVPQWLAFWAAGWIRNNVLYCHRIDRLLDDINFALASVREDNKGHLNTSNYLGILSFVRPIMTDSIGHGNEIHFPGPSHELHRLQSQFSRHEKDRIARKLSSMEWKLEEEGSLIEALRGGSDATGRRIELSIMCLLTLLLEHHRSIAVDAQTHIVDEDAFCNMRHALLTVFYAFHFRMVDLVLGWKQQRKEIDPQISCFAGGLYNGWYERIKRPNDALTQLRKLWHLESDAAEHFHSAVDQLSGQVALVQTQLDRMESLIRSRLPVDEDDHEDSMTDVEPSPTITEYFPARRARKATAGERKLDEGDPEHRAKRRRES